MSVFHHDNSSCQFSVPYIEPFSSQSESVFLLYIDPCAFFSGAIWVALQRIRCMGNLAVVGDSQERWQKLEGTVYAAFTYTTLSGGRAYAGGSARIAASIGLMIAEPGHNSYVIGAVSS